MTARINPRWDTVIRAPLTAALWAVSATAWTLLLLTDQAPHIRSAYFAAAVMSAMLACTRTAIARNDRNAARITEALERSDVVNAALADAATAVAFRGHGDTNRPAPCGQYPLTDLESLRPGGWSQDFYYDCARTPNVVPLRARRKNVS